MYFFNMKAHKKFNEFIIEGVMIKITQDKGRVKSLVAESNLLHS